MTPNRHPPHTQLRLSGTGDDADAGVADQRSAEELKQEEEERKDLTPNKQS